MMKKSEKLARELVALTTAYSERDFADAIELLESGSLFINAKSGAAAAFALKKRNSRNSSSGGAKRDIQGYGAKPLVERFPDAERPEVIGLARRIEQGELFPSNTHLRTFAEEIGVHLPQKTPARRDLLTRILSRLLMLDDVERREILLEALNRSTRESSLKRWSNLIVKTDDQK